MINTNGFLNEYNKTIENQLWLDKEEFRVLKALTIPHEKIKAIEEEYRVRDLERKLQDVTVSKRDTACAKEYYYFRAIVDGVYNIIKEYGWQYCDELINYIDRKYGIKFYCEESFQVCYLDYICELTLGTRFQHEYLDIESQYLVYQDFDYDLCIKMPDNLDIEKTLTNVKDYIDAYVQNISKEEEDAEYQMYLRLKKKYEEK